MAQLRFRIVGWVKALTLFAVAQAGIACGLPASATAQQREQPMQASHAYADYEINGRRFRVPERYLGGFPSGPANAKPGVFVKTSFIDVTFWLSDGKPSPVRGISLTTYWPKEAGRPSGGDEDFVVYAYRIEYLPPGQEKNEILPSQHLQRAFVQFLPASERTESSAYGLICYRSTQPGVHTVWCATPPGSDPDVLLMSDWLERSWPGGRPPNPSWRADIYSKADGLLISVRFPEVALRRWADVVCRTLTLVRSWQVPPDGSRAGCPGPRVTLNDRR